MKGQSVQITSTGRADRTKAADSPSGLLGRSATGVPTWIRTDDDPEGALAAWVHAAGDEVRGVLVVAPPMGREHVISYRTVRVLCVRAAEAGFAAVRFDWTGHGDSREMRPGEDLAARWSADLEAVVDRARDAVPGAPITIVGLRLGAAAAAATRWGEGPSAQAGGVSPREDDIRLIGWAPVGGRAFLREHAVLRRMSLGGVPPADGGLGTEISGDLLDLAQSASLRQLTVPRESTRTMTILPAQPGEELAWAAAFRYSRVPAAALSAILTHVTRCEPTHKMSWLSEPSAVQPVRGGSLDSVLETWTAVAGDSGIWGVTAAPIDKPTMRSAVFTAPDTEPRHGPSRMWTRCARILAGLGCSSLRTDRRGTGDSADPHELAEPNPYTEQTALDVAAAIHHQQTVQPAPVSAVGLCAGAWAAARAAAVVPVEELILINNQAWSSDIRAYRRLYRDSPITAALGGGAQLAQDPASTRARIYRGLKCAHREAQLVAPAALRRLGQRFGVFEDAQGLLPPGLKAEQVSVWSMSGDLESLARAGGRRAMRRWRRHGPPVALRPLAVPDHALLSHAARCEVQAMLARQLGDSAVPSEG